MRKKRYFRGLRFRLECGHEEVVVTSFYRLSKARAACIANARIRKGVWCWKCGSTCQPVKYLGTKRRSAAI